MKENLQQQITELFAHEPVVLESDCVIELVCFFDEIRAQRFVGLRRIPLATCAQIAHQRQSVVE